MERQKCHCNAFQGWSPAPISATPRTMNKLFLHNTLTNMKGQFVPGNPRRVTMYVCGPTVYSRPHIGNARPAVIFDILYRLLRHHFGEEHVVYARNITDVDDKIIEASLKTGQSITDISGKITADYHQDMRALGVMKPDIEPFATQHINEMIAFIKILIERGHAYEVDGHVLFDVTSHQRYGELSNRNYGDMVAGARVEVAHYKKNPADFVLWKPSTKDQPGWESSWGPNGGRGRPGWHIECSAMIEKHLGDTIDIHGGGQDLVFPHHENELAQSMCAHDAPLARVWMHNGFLSVNKDKMSKSLGNIVTVNDLLDAYDGEVIRFALLSAHYRKPLDWTEDLLAQSKATLDRLYGVLDALADIKAEKEKAPNTVVDALSDDLNTPSALAELSAIAKKVKTADDKSRLKSELLAAGKLLGILQGDPATWLRGDGYNDLDIEALINDRNSARANKDFSEADRIRDELATRGIILEDSTGGTKWRRTS